MDEIAILQNELKEEQDRQSERILKNHLEMLNMTKGLSKEVSKLKSGEKEKEDQDAQTLCIISYIHECQELQQKVLDHLTASSQSERKDQSFFVTASKPLNSSFMNTS